LSDLKCTEFGLAEDVDDYEGWLPPCPICGSDLVNFEPDCLEFPFDCDKCGAELIVLPSTEADPDMEYGGKICPISKPKEGKS
jgi:hypothetical protein